MPDNGTCAWPTDDVLDLPSLESSTSPTSAGDGHNNWLQWIQKVTGELRKLFQYLHGSGLIADLNFGSHKGTNAADGVANTDLATWGQVQALLNGLDWTHPAARVVATSNITLSGTQTIDGVAVIAGDRVLAAGQTTGSQNGLYVVASGAWARATDADTSAEVPPGMAVVVTEGTANGDTVWILTTNAPITLGSTALTFAELPTPNSLLAGAGLTRSGNTINAVANADASITVNADDIQVAALGITTGKIAANAVTSAKVDSSVEQTANKGAANGYMGVDANGNGSQPPKVHGRLGGRHTDYLKPADALRETFSRRNTMANLVVLSSQLEGLFGLECSAGDVIAAIAFHSATNLANTPTNQWFAFRDSSYAKLGVTADDGVTAWAANAQKKLYVSRSVTDAAITTGTNTLTSATAAFTAGDVGKQVTIMGAGAAGVPLGTSAARVTIASVTNSTTAVLSANAGTTVSGATAYIATPYTVGSDGLFFVGCMVKATAVPSFLCETLPGTGYTDVIAPIIAGQDQTHTGLTTPSTAPATSAAPTAFGGTAYAYVSST